jgi:hypothetical protein
MDLKEAIKQQLKVIPQSVVNGGLMTSVRWKEKALKAQKVLKHPNPKRSDLEDVLNELRHF